MIRNTKKISKIMFYERIIIKANAKALGPIGQILFSLYWNILVLLNKYISKKNIKILIIRI